MCARGTEARIFECFLDEQLYVLQFDLGMLMPDIVNYLIKMIPEGWNKLDKDRFLRLVKFYIWDDLYSNIILIILSRDASQIMGLGVSYLSIMNNLMEGTFVGK